MSYDSCNTFSLFLRNFQAWVTISISVHSYQFIRLLLRTNLPNLVIKKIKPHQQLCHSSDSEMRVIVPTRETMRYLQCVYVSE